MPSVLTRPSTLRVLTPLTKALGDHGDQGSFSPSAALLVASRGSSCRCLSLGTARAIVPARAFKGALAIAVAAVHALITPFAEGRAAEGVRLKRPVTLRRSSSPSRAADQAQFRPAALRSQGEKVQVVLDHCLLLDLVGFVTLEDGAVVASSQEQGDHTTSRTPHAWTLTLPWPALRM
jgi:hypothetical protein